MPIKPMTGDEMDGEFGTPPSSTFAEPPTTAHGLYRPGSSDSRKGLAANGNLQRTLSQGISLHFDNEKEYQEYELDRQRNPVISECPATADDIKPRDPHWTPTYDGSVRPRLELSYVKPEEYNGVLHPRNQGSQEAKNTHPPIVEEPTPSPSPPDSPSMETPEANLVKKKKKKKKIKKKKVVKIREVTEASDADDYQTDQQEE